MRLKRSQKHYLDNPAKQAVVDRYNAMFNAKSGEEADWAEIFAELIDAYFAAGTLQEPKK